MKTAYLPLTAHATQESCDAPPAKLLILQVVNRCSLQEVKDAASHEQHFHLIHVSEGLGPRSV